MSFMGDYRRYSESYALVSSSIVYLALIDKYVNLHWRKTVNNPFISSTNQNISSMVKIVPDGYQILAKTDQRCFSKGLN